MSHLVCMYRSNDNFVELILSFPLYVVSGNWLVPLAGNWAQVPRHYWRVPQLLTLSLQGSCLPTPLQLRSCALCLLRVFIYACLRVKLSMHIASC